MVTSLPGELATQSWPPLRRPGPKRMPPAICGSTEITNQVKFKSRFLVLPSHTPSVQQPHVAGAPASPDSPDGAHCHTKGSCAVPYGVGARQPRGGAASRENHIASSSSFPSLTPRTSCEDLSSSQRGGSALPPGQGSPSPHVTTALPAACPLRRDPQSAWSIAAWLPHLQGDLSKRWGARPHNPSYPPPTAGEGQMVWSASLRKHPLGASAQSESPSLVLDPDTPAPPRPMVQLLTKGKLCPPSSTAP